MECGIGDAALRASGAVEEEESSVPAEALQMWAKIGATPWELAATHA